MLKLLNIRRPYINFLPKGLNTLEPALVPSESRMYNFFFPLFWRVKNKESRNFFANRVTLLITSSFVKQSVGTSIPRSITIKLIMLTKEKELEKKNLTNPPTVRNCTNVPSSLPEAMTVTPLSSLFNTATLTCGSTVSFSRDPIFLYPAFAS